MFYFAVVVNDKHMWASLYGMTLGEWREFLTSKGETVTNLYGSEWVPKEE